MFVTKKKPPTSEQRSAHLMKFEETETREYMKAQGGVNMDKLQCPYDQQMLGASGTCMSLFSWSQYTSELINLSVRKSS